MGKYQKKIESLLTGFKPEFGNQKHITAIKEMGKLEDKIFELDLLEAKKSPVKKIVEKENEVERIIGRLEILLKK